MANKLELTWYGKENEVKVEPRLLIENKELSNTANDHDTQNMLIHGDNLLALKALESKYANKIKCIYIDPPYNTGSAFEHYDDNLEHSQWLSLMKPRLEILKNLLSDDGCIFIQIDNNEMAYLKVLCDEIFGRNNFINDIIWKRRGGSANPNNRLNNVTDYILWYSKTQNYKIFPIYSLDDENTQQYIAERFKNEFNGKKYMLAPVERNAKLGLRETMRYEYKGYIPKWGWMMSRENLEKLDAENRLHWNTKGRPNRRVFLEDYKGQPVGNLWTDIKVINPMSKERLEFDGQKPESLIQRILSLVTVEDDLVLDSFLGTGTTAAVAHKMNRKYIGIEMKEHCYSYCKVRLDKVISGEDNGGITESVNWQGGGGYRFYELAPTLINQDAFGEYIINKEYNADMLAAAVALHEGFSYNPSPETFWKQSTGSENSYLFVTTKHITTAYLQAIKDTMQDNEYLIIACKSYDEKAANAFGNIVIKKIPQMLLNRCEFNKDNYNLNIVHPPVYDEVEDDE